MASLRNVEEIRQVSTNFEVGRQSPLGRNVVDGGVFGFRFFSEDGRYILQMGKYGFTFSRIHPYETWDSFFGEASRTWRLYANRVQPEDVSRIGIRYINRIFMPIPKEREDLQKYLTTCPVLPPRVPQYVSQ